MAASTTSKSKTTTSTSKVGKAKKAPPASDEMRLDPAKAQDELLRVVKWLQSLDYRTRLAVVLSHELLMHEDELMVNPGYGNFKKYRTGANGIANDLLHDWEQEILKHQSPPDDPNGWIEGFTTALMNV